LVLIRSATSQYHLRQLMGPMVSVVEIVYPPADADGTDLIAARRQINK
jgi:hypothetical protein